MKDHAPEIDSAGAVEVAHASFGTAFGVSVLVVIAGLVLQLNLLLLSIAAICMTGAGLGYLLWIRGQ